MVHFDSGLGFRYDTYDDVIDSVASALNNNAWIATDIIEYDEITNKPVTEYKPIYSAKLEWTSIMNTEPTNG